MEHAFGMEIGHADGDVPCYRDALLLRQIDGAVLDQLIERTTVYVLGEGVKLALVDAHAH